MTTHFYRLPSNVVSHLEVLQLSADELRLFHGLFALLNFAVKDELKLIPVHSLKPLRVRTAQISDNVGTPGCKDHRWIKRAVPGLLESRLFKVLEISENGRYLRFQLDQSVGNRCLNPDQFARLDTGVVKLCRTPTDVYFYTRAAMHQRQKWPKFELPGIGDTAPKRPWRETRDAWVRSAEMIGKLLGHSYLIAPSRTPLDTVASYVVVKIQHASTAWKAGRLYKFAVGTRPIVVKEGKSLGAITGDELKRRVSWTEI